MKGKAKAIFFWGGGGSGHGTANRKVSLDNRQGAICRGSDRDTTLITARPLKY